MRQPPPPSLFTDINRPVWEHIAKLSAHPEIVDELLWAVKPLGDVQIYCPDFGQCRYVAASALNIVFAFAIGMHGLCFRLDPKLKSRALASGAEDYPVCGPEWVFFPLFRPDWPKHDLEFWALKAYVAAREIAERLGGNCSES
jgi:hypothetical protein